MAFTFNPTDEPFSFNPADLGGPVSYIQGCSDQPTGEQKSYNNWLHEIINLYGVIIRYYPYKFSLEEMNSLFGEDMTTGFDVDKTFRAYVEISENSNTLSRFGIVVKAAVSLAIPFDTWDQYFKGQEPKAGDVFVVINTGCGRQGGRTAEVFEVTKRYDRKNAGGDFLGRHYGWFIEASRYEYAYEPGAPPEAETTDVSDEDIFGRLPGDHNPESPHPAKLYDQNVEAMSNNIKTYSDNRDSVFGNY
jgi:hypothetical protein